jgi:Sulfotransferase domain
MRVIMPWGCITEITHTGLRVALSTDLEKVGSIALQINGKLVAKVPPMQQLEFNIVRYLAPNEKVEVLILDPCGECRQVLEWGFSGPSLPEEWHEDRGAHRYPSLFLLGAAKSATTSLHFWLNAHPDVFMSRPKEPFFFEAEYDRGAEFYFRKYFSGWGGQRIVGESRHRNLYLPFVPRRIHRFNPAAKLLVVLRNPVGRAISHWWHYRSRQMEPLSLSEALCADLERIKAGHKFESEADATRYSKLIYKDLRSPHRTYLDSGYYAEQIERYVDLFGIDRLHVVFFEELIAGQHTVMNGIFRFLGVDPPRQHLVNYSPENVSHRGAWERLDITTEDWLREHYEVHNRRLERLLGRIPPCWSQPLVANAKRGKEDAESAALSQILPHSGENDAQGNLS